jgi:structural maintenance of chromosome 3 (chondroitin sulfate proteoglycan 6)
MHIQSITIKNFKSYRDFSLIESLDSKINLIIGQNGHGKSNFLDAIIFVLTDKYSNLRHEDKKNLVHEEPGEEITQISVELVIENKLRRFPIDKDFIKITKIYFINENIEEILINDKKFLKSDFNNLLESGGFCRQNPYYIIQQGKINNFINMNDAEIFDQFSEITGTKIYEEKKAESLKLLEEASENKQKIAKQSEQIEEYIEKLENQCKDLSSFEKLEKRKKACQEIIFAEKLTQIQIACDLLEERKAQKSTEYQDLYKDLNEIKSKLNLRLQKQSVFEARISKIKSKIVKCDEEISNLKNFQSKENASLNFFEKNKENSEKQKDDLLAELADLHSKKLGFCKSLEAVMQKLNFVFAEISNMEKTFNGLDSKIDMLTLKQSAKATGFSSDAEKKKYIEAEMLKFQKLKEECNKEIIKNEAEITSEESKLHKLLGELESQANEKANLSNSLSEIKITLAQKQKTRVENVNLIKKNDLKVNEFNEELETIQENSKGTIKMIPNYEVLSAVLGIKRKNIPGIIGILIEIIDVDPRFKDAVDLIAKDKLYSVIVDNFETASKIIEINKERKGPVISILPLDWNKDYSSKYNYQNLKDSSPLVNYVKIKSGIIANFDLYKKDLENLIHKIFGKTLLVKNYEIGLSFAKQVNMNCITRDNEIIYAGAILTKIGSYDNQRQRLNYYEQINNNFIKTTDLTLLKEQFEKMKIDFGNTEGHIIREIHSLQIRKNDTIRKIESISNQECALNEEISNQRELLSIKKAALEKSINERNNLEEKHKNYSSMVSNDKSNNNKNNCSTAALNSQTKNIENSQFLNKEEIIALKNERFSYEKRLIELQKAKKQMEESKIQVESELNNSIYKREAEIKNNLRDLEHKTQGSKPSQANDNEEGFLRAEVEASYHEINSLETYKEKLKYDLCSAEKALEDLLREIKLVKSEQSKIADKINMEENELKSILLSFNENSEKKNSFVKKIANLGKIDSSEKEALTSLKNRNTNNINQLDLEKYTQPDKKVDKVLEPIFAELEKVNLKLKKFEKINRFALEDHKNFKQKREEISEKLQDLQEKEKEILNVIKILDEKKENAINTTFEKVNKSFEFFFKELVPSGKACLELYDIISGNATQIPTQNSFNNSKINKPKGISVKVSFMGSNAFQNVHLLSGGQRTAVAVSLIFALSRVDQAPFYILDEIDAALDVSMRANLAKLICSLAVQNQFIVSTFKSEILDVADNVYRVKFANKTTNITKISKDEAKVFIREINNS